MGPPPDGSRQAIWDPVNSAVRLSSEAGAGELLISGSAAAAFRLDFAWPERRSLALKGRAEPMTVVVERAGARRDTERAHPRV